jgi:uncharacterized membrane protein
MQDALTMKRDPTNMKVYIKFIGVFAPAITGVMHWNNNKAIKPVNDILTISDEAFIHLCIINYSATWKAQERKKQAGEGLTKVPVSNGNCF